MAEQGKGKVRGSGSQSDGMEGRSGSLLVVLASGRVLYLAAGRIGLMEEGEI